MIFSIPVAPPFEIRTLAIVQGLDFTNAQFRKNGANDLLVPNAVAERLKKRKLELLETSGTTFAYYSQEQGVLYNAQLIYDKADFKKALETPDLHVIYSGHSRIGRGPCFGPDVFKQPGEQWENGEEDGTGLFRMGYPFVPVPVSDVADHGYTAFAVPSDVSIDKANCHPMLQASYGKMKEFTISELESKLDKGHRRPRWHVEDPDQLFKKFWGVDMVSVAGVNERHAVLFAGWDDTQTKPMDLGATDIQCKVLCVFACSTQMHFAKVLRDRKQWAQNDDDGFGFFTTEAACMDIAPSWIYHLLTYNKFSANQPLKELLEYVRGKTNQDLIAAGRNYKVVGA
jgi:hypothetical protein